MPRDYLPASDADLRLWLIQFNSRVSTFAAAANLTPADLTSLTSSVDSYNSALADRQNALAAGRAATAQKQAARKAVVDKVRALANRIQASPAVTDADRLLLGITAGPAPVASLTTAISDLAPQVKLDFGTRGQITVHFGPNPANESRNGLPPGAAGAVIQARLISAQNGDAPTSPGTWQWLDNPSRSPYVHQVQPAVVTVLAYRVAYRYSRGRKGPWSEPSQAACTPAV